MPSEYGNLTVLAEASANRDWQERQQYEEELRRQQREEAWKGTEHHYGWAAKGMAAGAAYGPMGAGIGAAVGGVAGATVEGVQKYAILKDRMREKRRKAGKSTKLSAKDKFKLFGKSIEKTFGRAPNKGELTDTAGAAGAAISSGRQSQLASQALRDKQLQQPQYRAPPVDAGRSSAWNMPTSGPITDADYDYARYGQQWDRRFGG